MVKGVPCCCARSHRASLPQLLRTTHCSREGQLEGSGWSPNFQLARNSQENQISTKPVPIQLFTLLQVFPTPAQQPVATPLMTPSYSYTTPSQPITTPQYHQLQASTTPQSAQAQPQPKVTNLHNVLLDGKQSNGNSLWPFVTRKPQREGMINAFYRYERSLRMETWLHFPQWVHVYC